MKKSIQYIIDHKDDSFIFNAANKMIKEGFSDDVIVINVIIYLNNLVKTKDTILNSGKVA